MGNLKKKKKKERKYLDKNNSAHSICIKAAELAVTEL